MKLTDMCMLPARPDVVWAALNDPRILEAVLPGCESLHMVDERHFEAKVQARVGPVSATFRGAVELTDLEPPHAYTIIGRGNAGAAGFAKVDARVRLEAQGDATLLIYEADVEVGGKLMSVGARLIQSAAARQLESFFDAFRFHIEQGALRDSSVACAALDGAVAFRVASDVAAAVEQPRADTTAHPDSRIGVGSRTTGTRRTAWATYVATGVAAGVAGLVIGFVIGHGF
ncbi:carbon monoxide dehydrogenase subunit G [Paraburkholderia sp. J11-2]|uniref:SRPBCC family protein n=1 Tax=Paraburkholderia sp. J11-2 TaxID=2805431 RepID=UPI002AB7DEAF|nr:carbon monoxide dehydrogenase subunit G [Paraburkholderia sp. J11-2]